jgi:L-iditol 2-dehydrogenase
MFPKQHRSLIMKEAIVERVRCLTLRETDIPEPREGWTLIEVDACGVCGSELHVWEGRHPKVQPPMPHPLGHEASGRVARIHGEEHGLKQGDKVAIVPLIGCGACVYCRQGAPNRCVRRTVVGFQIPGCFAQYVAVPTVNCIKLPDDADMAEATLLEPLAVVIHCAKLLGRIDRQAQNAVVTGAGTIGILNGLYLQEKVGLNVALVEINEKRRELADRVGLSTFASVEDVPFAGERTVAVECTGSRKALDGLLAMEPAPEALVILGTFDKTQTLNIFELCKREMFVVGSQMYVKDDLVDAAAMLAPPFVGKARSLFIPRRYALDEIQEAFEEALVSTAGTKAIVQVKA